MKGAELSAALRGGHRVYGTCIVSPSPMWPSMIASIGFDFVFIDTEHIALDRQQLAWMCRTYDALDLAPIVRVPEPDPYLACVALDGGASGVIFPYVESLAQVRALRGAVKLRPLKGRSLYDYLEGRAELPSEVGPFLSQRNKDRVMIVNIESRAAMELLDDILEVPDIDALLVGPHDLSINLGVPERYDEPVFQEAISVIIQKARAANVGVGVHYSWGVETQIEWARQGANLILNGSDLVAAQQSLRTDLDQFKTTLGDKIRRIGPSDEVI